MCFLRLQHLDGLVDVASVYWGDNFGCTWRKLQGVEIAAQRNIRPFKSLRYIKAYLNENQSDMVDVEQKIDPKKISEECYMVQTIQMMMDFAKDQPEVGNIVDVDKLKYYLWIEKNRVLVGPEDTRIRGKPDTLVPLLTDVLGSQILFSKLSKLLQSRGKELRNCYKLNSYGVLKLVKMLINKYHMERCLGCTWSLSIFANAWYLLEF